jgi:hypothetical protein
MVGGDPGRTAGGGFLIFADQGSFYRVHTRVLTAVCVTAAFSIAWQVHQNQAKGS